MVEATNNYDPRELRRRQVEARTVISTLYGQLILSEPELDSHLVNAAHDWSLTNIKNVTQDLLARIPNGQEPRSFYSKHFSTPNKESRVILTRLATALEAHDLAGTRIEQHTKGVL